MYLVFVNGNIIIICVYLPLHRISTLDCRPCRGIAPIWLVPFCDSHLDSCRRTWSVCVWCRRRPGCRRDCGSRSYPNFHPIFFPSCPDSCVSRHFLSKKNEYIPQIVIEELYVVSGFRKIIITTKDVLNNEKQTLQLQQVTPLVYKL